MKIVLSPSKTKTITNAASNAVNHAVRDGQFQPHLTQEIIKHVRSLDVTALGKALKLKDDKAQELFDFYQSFESQPVGIACESYDGIAFKYLDWQNLSDEAKAFGESHLVVMSALYGVVEPMMGVRDYRLDMVDKVDGIDAVDFQIFVEVGFGFDAFRFDFKQLNQGIAQQLVDFLFGHITPHLFDYE